MMGLTVCWGLSTRLELTYHGISGAYCCFILKLIRLDEGYEDLGGEDDSSGSKCFTNPQNRRTGGSMSWTLEFRRVGHANVMLTVYIQTGSSKERSLH